MLILLKLLCIIVWLVIILYLAGGGLRSYCSNEVKIIAGENDLETDISRALSRLKKNDRLVIEVRHNFLACPSNRVKVKKTLRENPSLIYSLASENWSC